MKPRMSGRVGLLGLILPVGTVTLAQYGEVDIRLPTLD